MQRLLPLLLVIGLALPSRAAVAVLTQHNDLSRTGANLQETVLTVTNVNTNQFGLVYSRPVDDQIYAQPLIMTNVAIPGVGARNLLIVATMSDSVYAYDADDPTVTAPYWHVSFTNANIIPVRNTDMTGACQPFGYSNYTGNIGIVPTPAIDPATQRLYVLAYTRDLSLNFYQTLHALDLRTGAEITNVVITAACAGSGEGNVGGVITFDPQKQNPRSALTLVNGTIYLACGSHCDWRPYHGWLLGYDATTLQQVALYNTTSNGIQGGIWMAGQGPAVDASGNLYLSVGNGSVGTSNDPRDPSNRAESFLKLVRAGSGFNLASWFTPNNYDYLNEIDLDLGSAGLLLIPNTSLLFSGGKQGYIYLANRDNLGGLSTINADTNIVQSFQVATGTHELLGPPVWWDGPDGSYGYLWVSGGDLLRQYKFDRTTGMFQLPNYASGAAAAPSGLPGGMLSLSANGTNAGSGIVWAAHQLGGSASQVTRPGILRALDAQNVGNELWNSEQLSARDSVGNFAKFVPPTIANGKVYLATFSDRVNVYGLLPTPTLGLSRVKTNVVLQWPTNNFPGFTVQAASNLSNASWVSLTNNAILTNGAYQVTVPATNSSRYYRLER